MLSRDFTFVMSRARHKEIVLFLSNWKLLRFEILKTISSRNINTDSHFKVHLTHNWSSLQMKNCKIDQIDDVTRRDM